MLLTKDFKASWKVSQLANLAKRDAHRAVLASKIRPVKGTSDRVVALPESLGPAADCWGVTSERAFIRDYHETERVVLGRVRTDTAHALADDTRVVGDKVLRYDRRSKAWAELKFFTGKQS